MSALTCLTAPGVVFESKADWSAHYKSEWHRYNLRRKTNGLELVAEEEFEARRAAAAQTSSSSAVAKQSHVKPSKREAVLKDRKLKGFVDVGGAKTTDAASGFRALQQEQARARVAAEAETAAEAAARAALEGGAEPEEDEGLPPVCAEANAEDSIFDSKRFATVDESLEHMASTYGFFLPEARYLADKAGLAKYLCHKVKQDRVCLYCERVFFSFSACQQHMIDKQHAKVPYYTDDQVDELSEFYDFTSSYDDYDAADAQALVPKEHKARVGDEDGWETESEGDDDAEDAVAADADPDGAEARARKRAVPKVTVMESGELLVQRGGQSKIVGARWLRQYYRQNYRLDDDRESTVAVREEHNERLLAVYKLAGVDMNAVGFFARGLAAQFNKRAIHGVMLRDKRNETRRRNMNMGMHSGRAKNMKGNKIIKHKTAGKNMGEGTGVHG
ncbi:C2H2 type zinc-finger-domain-containing protein [Pelagophyceae sp. CCMP2097]|nr:C2H2 type zinc-finger-domain-containing protein [Pelagophyceae sp. CCMP2097]